MEPAFHLLLSKDLLSGLIAQGRQRSLIVKARVGRTDGGFGLLQLCLAELDDRAQSEVVTGLGEIEREIGLIEQLL